eukprot:CAMPEP_0184012312 /NCGR_PEP_ID=MMETSP0954-20121128/4330_1 /TAXON_ID=627963 /ORGANISM="Aplanochytrium sp, Strain PBS07" /LENGTH=359 /DNA_ID=CAMNT_0026292261 /DNA_START=90 /DNA_END=1166 /DNA_ORIENTATION=-
MLAARYAGKPASGESLSQQKRREKALEGQKSARQRRIQENRFKNFQVHSTGHGNTNGRNESRSTDVSEDHMCVTLAEKDQFEKRKCKRKTKKPPRNLKYEKLVSEEFQLPEWLIDIPSDLVTPEHSMDTDDDRGWLVVPRPEGHRCLLFAQNGFTSSRKKNGRLLHHRFSSLLPGGSSGSRSRASDLCILDCIFQERIQSYCVIDILCWKGQSMTECTAAMRFFWLQSRLREIADVDKSGNSNKFPLILVPKFNSDVSGIKKTYTQSFGYEKDGILFYNKVGHYSKGLSPLVLVWKDSNTSRFSIDSPDGVTPYAELSCVLKLEKILQVPTTNTEFVLIALGGDIVEVVPSTMVLGQGW